MANYYNVTMWKHTGFDYKNRPFSRDVLNQDYFINPENRYSQMKGIAVNRSDMTQITYIDLQGSVKDLQGDQVNAPNATGSQGTGGPWYSLEEVDYIRLARTGYPGDPDYIDISNNQLDPWNADEGGRKQQRIAYYFVTGLEPRARDVTRVYLDCDLWTTCGASDELEIEYGYKTRGMITDSEDSSSYNLASENIGIIEPLEVKGRGDITPSGDTTKYSTVLVTSVDMTQYSEEQNPDTELKPLLNLEAFMATTANGNGVAVPVIKSISNLSVPYIVRTTDPSGDTKINIYDGYGAFDYTNKKVQYNLSVLYSLGQVELQSNYKLPQVYGQAVDTSGGKGKYGYVENTVSAIANPVSKDIGSYPRKADYMYGQEVLYSKLSGESNVQPFYNLSDDSINVWAIPSPSGYPIARFKGIKGHDYVYDQICKGMPWEKASVIVEGASGSYWLQQQIAYNESARQRQSEYLWQQGAYLGQEQEKEQWMNWLGGAATAVGAGIAGAALIALGGVITAGTYGAGLGAGAGLGTAGLSLIGGATAGLLGTAKAQQSYEKLSISQQKEWDTQINKQRELRYNQESERLDEAKALMQSPSTFITADIDNYNRDFNGFGIYVVNTTAKDRERLKNYYRHYGYRGLYKPLTWEEINVKQKVNYIEAENVTLAHEYYPMRSLVGVSNLLSQGVWLWNEKPSQSAFNENPDN